MNIKGGLFLFYLVHVGFEYYDNEYWILFSNLFLSIKIRGINLRQGIFSFNISKQLVDLPNNKFVDPGKLTCDKLVVAGRLGYLGSLDGDAVSHLVHGQRNHC